MQTVPIITFRHPKHYRLLSLSLSLLSLPQPLPPPPPLLPLPLRPPIDSVAYRDGRVNIGDRLISIDEAQVSNLPYHVVAQMIKAHGLDKVTLVFDLCNSKKVVFLISLITYLILYIYIYI